MSKSVKRKITVELPKPRDLTKNRLSVFQRLGTKKSRSTGSVSRNALPCKLDYTEIVPYARIRLPTVLAIFLLLVLVCSFFWVNWSMHMHFAHAYCIVDTWNKSFFASWSAFNAFYFDFVTRITLPFHYYSAYNHNAFNLYILFFHFFFPFLFFSLHYHFESTRTHPHATNKTHTKLSLIHKLKKKTKNCSHTNHSSC